ncbi:lysosomal Pro-X carboxypeptidase-like [Punica granatum]|uniref:Lysosomal Pro-X carboxypeptidase-like n=2 Tax=Punica granatum TaxID=22663 RepID=A0A6P8E998_PUNGR|nr:lysosomal Pro-X carboxypeptidase-like [Punica granatum]
MSSTYGLFGPLLLSLLLFSSSTSASHLNRIPSLRIAPDSFLQDSGNAVTESILNETQTFFFDQTLDHFNYMPESYATFKHKYVINFKYWGGANSSAPIFAFLGGEEPVAQDIPAVGFLTDNAPRFKALILYIEHRFYGESIPFGLSLEEALNNSNTRGHFNSAQTLADYAEVIIHVKRMLNAQKSPVIVMGGSYGGMLAAWFRLKYPHIALGAFASSAPILLPVNFTPHYGYYTIVSKGFRETSETCYETIKRSWSAIDRVASKQHGLQYLTETFNTCEPLSNASELKDYLISMYATAAQYNDPFTTPVAKLCDAVNSNGSSSILNKIFAGVVATMGNSTNSSCYDITPPRNASQTTLGWSWQNCSDIIMPLARNNKTMFQPDSDTLHNYIEYCKRSYGIAPRPHWISTYYGGQDIKLTLQRFGSNIIFSNGLKDPFSNGGVLANISDTIVAVYTAKGSHCLDLIAASAKDPDWLVKQRETEVEIMGRWIHVYYNDLKELQDS